MGDKNKSGYELRTELLGMAVGILQDRQNRQECNEHFKAENNSTYQRQPVNPYATEDVLVVAQKLYDFVQSK